MNDWRRLLALFRPHRGVLNLGLLLAIVVFIANVALMALAGWFITGMALAGLGLGAINYFAPAAGIRGLAIVRTGGRYLERLITHDATLRVLATLRVDFYTRLEPLAPARLQNYRRADLLSRMRADIDTLDNFYLRVFVPAAAAGVGGSVVCLFAATYSPAVAGVNALGLVLAGGVLPYGAYRAGRATGMRRRDALAELRGLATDGVRGMAELWTHRATVRQRERLAAASRQLIGVQRVDAIRDAIATALSSLMAYLALWLALVFAIPLVATGAMTGPVLAMLVFLVIASYEAVLPMAMAFRSLGETAAAARRVFDVLDAEPAVVDPAHPCAGPARFDIGFADATLRYTTDVPPALAGLNLHVPAGRVVALVGPSGAGKSSVFNVLLRFWPLAEGRVTIGGVDVATLDADQVRRLCAVVTQDSHLFNDSVAANLRLACPKACDATLYAALAHVGLEPMVAALPQGLQTPLGEAGTRLSGGEQRRLVIARALLADRPILLLDEPTEGLDGESEAAVVAALRTLLPGRTVLVITHRPAVLRLADDIALIEHGRVVERATTAAADNAHARFWTYLRLG